jgi:DNA-binding SARP family transcriptional activator
VSRIAESPAGLWVASPPASGKTLLAASALCELKRPGCWLHVDAGDADPGSFFHFLAQAADRWPARRGASPLPVYRREVVAGLDDFARGWFRALAARLPENFVVVLDDWHHLPENSVLHSALAQALAELPRGASLWVLSRNAPPASFDAPRLRGQLALLDFSDLALTTGEVRSLLLAHSTGAVADLDNHAAHWHRWCEGWVGALTFALATDRPVPTGLPQVTLSPQDDTVFGFLSAELFERSTPDEQEFLLITAWLPHVSETLVGLALPRLKTARIIAALSRRSLLLSVETGAETSWRYHRLLKDFLRRRSLDLWGDTDFRRRLGALGKGVHAEGLPEAAADLLIAARDFNGLVKLIETEGPSLVRGGRFLTILAWVDALPEAHRTAWIHYWNATALLAQDVRASARAYERAFNGFMADENPDGLYRSWCGAVEANTFACDDFRVLEAWMRRLRDLRGRFGSAPTLALRAQVWVYGFSAIFFSDPRAPEFDSWLRNVKRLYRLAPRRNDRLAVGGLLGLYHASISGMGGLRAHMLQLKPLIDDDTLSPFHRLVAMLPDVMQHWIGGQINDALQSLQRYAALASETGAHAMDHQIAFQSAYVHGVRGDLQALDEQLALLERRLPTLGRIDGAQYDFLAGWRAALAGRLAEALHLLERSVDNAHRHRFAFFEVIGRGLLAELRATAGDFEAARRQADEAVELGYRLGSVTALVACRMQRAVVAELASENDAVIRPLLGDALGFARRSGHWAWGGLMPENLARLAMRALSLEVETEFVRELVVRRQLNASGRSVAHPSWPWPVKVRALGPLALETRGSVAHGAKSTSAQRPLDLLRALVCVAPAPLPVQTAIGWLWPDDHSADDRKLFDTTLHRLRKLMGDDQAVRLEGGKLSLDAERVWTDVGALAAVLDDDAADATVRARALLLLVRGRLLAGDEAPWIRLARTRWRRRIAHAVKKIGDEVGDVELVLDLLDGLFDADPASEPLMRRLSERLEGHNQHGRAKDVLELFNAARQSESGS